MKSAFILFLLSVWVQDVVGIYGGSMSYSTTVDPSGYLKVRITLFNGWKKGKGPCNNCTGVDIGTSVTDRRKQATSLNPYVFGNWSVEQYESGLVLVLDKTNEMTNLSKDSVLLVSKKEGWELEVSKFSVNFPITQNEFDIMYTGNIDDRLTLLPKVSKIRLQVKIDPGIRSDTHRPNNSPVVLVKPFYSLEFGKNYTLHLASVDNDGDAVRCDIAVYIEAIGFEPFLRDLQTKHLFSLDRMKCAMKIIVDPRKFNEGDTFGGSITVKDYAKNRMSIHDQGRDILHVPYSNVIGRVVVLMLFKITGRTDPPEFVPSTPNKNQEYIIYVGGDFNVNVYAKASTGRTIARIDIFREDGKPVKQTGIQDASHISANTVSKSVIWSSTEEDIGHHIICANAEDNQGRSTVDLQCFRIHVKENIFRPGSRPVVSRYPRFVSFPDPSYLMCKQDVYCIFPIFVTTADTKEISIISTPETMENVTIRYTREAINDTFHIKVAQVEFFARHAGIRQICLKASDSITFAQRCLFVTVERQDPCASNPCHNGGRCVAFDCNIRYVCSCNYPFTGRSCETRMHACDSNPCPSNGTCYEIPLGPIHFLCICQNSKSGRSEECRAVQQTLHAPRASTTTAKTSSQQIDIGHVIG